MKKILLIEPNSDIMSINTSALRMRKYDVLQAFSLAQAEELLKQHKPNAIVMEAVLPDGDGLEFCRNIKENSKIPILFLSILGESCDIVAGLRSGADDYITKPYDLGVLAARIEAKLKNYDKSC